MGVHDFFKTNNMTQEIRYVIKEKKINYIKWKNTRAHFHFDNRASGQKKLCIILSGYKEFLYESVFGRVAKFVDDDVDVCIITSGLYSDKIANICIENKWSYLSTKENNVALVQNLAIILHPQAEYIFKLDEDIFITENYFKKMYNAYIKCENDGPYQVGFIAPLIPVNGYGHMRILDKLGLEEEYTKRFERPKFAAGNNRMIENNPDVAKFMWDEIPSIDELNYRFNNDTQCLACPIRFSIGAILFTRTTWEKMGMFTVHRNSSDMGKDELELCGVAMKYSQAILVAENVVVGHLSFGSQNQAMVEFYLSHKDKFAKF